jgi:hypothetical protein
MLLFRETLLIKKVFKIYVFTYFLYSTCKIIAAERTTQNNSQLSYIEEKKTETIKTIESKDYCFPVKNHLFLSGDFLFFKAIEDSLNYAEKLPQNSTFSPKVKSVGQRFDYEPGYRVGAVYSNNPWKFTMMWMHYDISPSSRQASESDFGLLATLATPVWGALGNSLVSQVKGHWKLQMNALDILLARVLCFNKFSFTPLSGIKAALIEQKIHTQYKNFQIDFPDEVSPSKVTGKSSFWGVGPTLGIELNYFIAKKFSIFFNGQLSFLAGNFNTKTLYQEFEPDVTPPDSEIDIKNSETRISAVEQIQAGIDKVWSAKRAFIEIALGWEIQVWQKQMRLNYFSTFVSPPSGSDLTLYGPFLRLRVSF